MRHDNRLYFSDFDEPADNKDNLLNKVNETEVWKMKRYLEKEMLVDFETEFGKTGNFSAVKLIGKTNYDDTIFHFTVVFDGDEVEDIETYVNLFTEVDWDGEKVICDGKEITEVI